MYDYTCKFATNLLYLTTQIVRLIRAVFKKSIGLVSMFYNTDKFTTWMEDIEVSVPAKS